jgi:hypothetical protein
VVIMPPSEVPQAIARRGAPNRARNSSSVASWAGSARSSTQPVSGYEEPICAYPASSSAERTASLGALCAGLGAPSGVYPWL